MVSKTVGSKWVINEISFKSGLYSSQTLGYDAQKKKFVGTWVDASSSHIWRYEGTLDAAGKTLTMQAEGPDMADPKKMRLYRDAYHFESKNRLVVTTTMRNDKGEWTKFNTGKMTRKTK